MVSPGDLFLDRHPFLECPSFLMAASFLWSACRIAANADCRHGLPSLVGIKIDPIRLSESLSLLSVFRGLDPAAKHSTASPLVPFTFCGPRADK